MTITPLKSSYQIGEVIARITAAETGASEGDVLRLFLSDFNTYSASIISALAGPDGVGTFTNVYVPAFETGSDRVFVVRRVLDDNEEFSDAFTLLPAATPIVQDTPTTRRRLSGNPWPRHPRELFI